MRAALIAAYGLPLEIAEVPDPTPSPTGAVLRVEATGVCRSDWHAWMGHEQLPGLPHVPGHEMAGVVESVGPQVTRWHQGERVTVPFSIGCGACPSCRNGFLNTCDRPFTPGFTHWGSFAERVAIEHADLNLVSLPDGMSFVQGAALGCRFVTAFHALADQGRLRAGQWVAVHGCGGVGLSAVMIGAALGARVVAVDISREKLAFARDLGAEAAVNASEAADVGREVREITGGGAHLSVDALGSSATALSSLKSLRKHGRHIQVGLMHGPDASLAVPMEPVIMRELELIGARGLAATEYPRVFALLETSGIDPGRLVTRSITLEDVSSALADVGSFAGVGMTVVDRF